MILWQLKIGIASNTVRNGGLGMVKAVSQSQYAKAASTHHFMVLKVQGKRNDNTWRKRRVWERFES